MLLIYRVSSMYKAHKIKSNKNKEIQKETFFHRRKLLLLLW